MPFDVFRDADDVVEPDVTVIVCVFDVAVDTLLLLGELTDVVVVVANVITSSTDLSTINPGLLPSLELGISLEEVRMDNGTVEESSLEDAFEFW